MKLEKKTHRFIPNTTNILKNKKYHGCYKMTEENFCFKYIHIPRNITKLYVSRRSRILALRADKHKSLYNKKNKQTNSMALSPRANYTD
jgi:hypothetical protein